MAYSTPVSFRHIGIRIAWTVHAWLMIAAAAAFGHGNPVLVDVNDNTLIVSGGLPMAQGFAYQSVVGLP
jgi:hypothetical protein